MEKWKSKKQDSHFPTLVFCFPNPKTKGESIPLVTLILQAHLKIGKRSTGLRLRYNPNKPNNDQLFGVPDGRCRFL
ncbi:MAG TPA: hypothetical protein VHY84_01425, partial [Bryobacteraceae bacterium]|nr:hypothetical protein [Bryobacteraceae bacterium]